MSELASFLRQRLKQPGKRTDFSKAAKVSPGTVTKWLSGEHTPNFESCFVIAAYFGIDPLRVFEMAGRLDYGQLYLCHRPTEELRSRLHVRLQNLIEGGMSDTVEEMLNQLEESLADSSSQAQDRSA